MDPVDACTASSTGDNKRRVNKKNRDWLNRLHLRKTAALLPTVQSADKHGPKKIAAAAEERSSTMWPSSKKLRSQEAHERSGNTITTGNSLRFKCSQCTDSVEYAPKDLLKHFEKKHSGIPPVFSCHMCTFTAHDYSYLQVHLLSHKDTFSCCSICKDNVQRTWSEFSTHLTMVHSQNGKYTCDICKKFSTLDDKEFLEHILLHNLSLDRKSEHTVDKTTSQRFHCPCCGYEAAQKLLITKHIKATHGSVNCNPRNKDVHSFAVKPIDTKCRLTRSAVKEMCWLTEDCLSLPGREFLDKYCHLSDAQTTLEETEHFLMKSGKQNWTKALKNVLSNMPQDMTLHPKAENGIVSVFPDSSQDVNVLTVKNKMTPNGASFAKRLKMMTEKEVESANADSPVVGKITGDANLNDCLQKQEIKLNVDVLIAEPTEGQQMEENRENQRLKTHVNKHNAISEEPKPDGVTTNELKALHYTEEKKAVNKAIPKKKRKNRRWRNVKKSKKAEKDSALALKIVLKKNSESGKRWVTQSATKCNSAVDETPSSEKKCNKTLKMDAREGQGTTQNKQMSEDLRSGTLGTTNMAENLTEMLQDGGRLEEEVESRLGSETKSKQETREAGAVCGGSDEMKTPHNGSTEASPLAQSVITPQSDTGHLTSSEPTDVRSREARPTDSSLSSFEKSQSPADFDWKPVPKNLERTLHLVAINRNQLVKRPAGDQPVVVLNHPDADVPEVARIMEVVNRYKGEVHKVVLSKRTLSALSATNGEVTSPPSENNTQNNPGKNSVQERFLLKLKLRRLSRKKFEVVTADTSTSDTGERKFHCWFCGRAFESREMWLSHRQRHLKEWSPNCENS